MRAALGWVLGGSLSNGGVRTQASAASGVGDSRFFSGEGNLG